MEDISFITIADSKFIRPLKYSVRQVKNIYPESKMHIYDWGITDEHKEILKKENGNIEFIKWKFNPIDIKITFRKKIISKISKILKSNLILDHEYREDAFVNKVLCIKDFADKNKGKFIFLDADAIIINNIDEIIKDDSFDIGLTIRKKDELSLKYNNCRVLNLGVMFFMSSQNSEFCDMWLKEVNKSKEDIRDQSPLTRMIYKSKKDFKKENFKINNIKVKIFPCEIYNYNWIEEFDLKEDREIVKILHFKSNRYLDNSFDKFIKKLEI